MAPEKRSHDDYSVGWICALPKEQTAATAMLDERHPDLPKNMNDTNTYTLGSIGSHNVVIACLPKGQYGTNSAAHVATLMIGSFPSVKIGLMVGIGGGVPMKVRLGDVVVSTPGGQHAGVIQWDLGKATEGGTFERTGALSNPPGSLLTALAKLETEHELTGSKIPSFLDELKAKYPRLAKKYLKSDSLQDVLFKADYPHVNEPFMNTEGPTGGIAEPSQAEDVEESGGEGYEEPCLFCDRNNILPRRRRSMKVHYGLIASGNKVIKDALYRDKLNDALGGNVLCFEMEAAGLMNNFPCLVIRGICDYCDSHKNKHWQEHAAAVAAAFAKELLGCIQPSAVKGEQFMRDIMWDQTPEKMTATLVKQLAQNLRPFPEAVHQLHCRHNSMKSRPFLGELSNTLTSLIQSFSRVFILIDALDEGDDYDRKKFLDEVFTIQAKTGLNLFATSRAAINHIAAGFEGSIFRDISPTRHDIFQFLNARMSELPSFVANDKALQEEIKESIVSAIEGMFLLAQLYIYSLAGKRGPASIRVALQDIHTASSSDDRSRVLDVAYDKSMERIQQLKGDLPRDALLIISWIVKAKRQLKLIEIQEALAVELGAFKRNPDNIPTAEHISLACASLVIVKGDSVELVHYTAQEYFERPDNRWMERAHDRITDICMTYLSFSGFRHDLGVSWESLIRRCEEYPLYNYATAYWADHAKEALVMGLGVSRVIDFLANGQTQNSWYQDLLYSHSSQLFSLDAMPSRSTPLHVAAFFGLHHVVATLLAQGLSPNIHDSLLRKPIWWATWNGHTQVVEVLLSDTTDLEINDTEHGQTILHVAVLQGYEAIVALLLDQHNLESKDSMGRTSLMLAAQYGRQAVAEFLFSKGADIEAKDANGQAPLSLAAKFGHENIVKWLVEKGACLETKDNNNRTPLSLIAETLHPKISSYMTAKYNDTTTTYPGPSIILDWVKPEIIAEYLIEKGANIETEDSNDETPLMLAIKSAQTSLTACLIDNGANLEAKDENGDTLLTWAIKNEKSDLIAHLIEKGADLEARDENGDTVLTWTIKQQKSDLGTYLIEKGARLDAKDENGDTLLTWAIKKRKTDLVTQLIEKGADLEATDRSGQTPLILATKSEQKSLMICLISKGANIEAMDLKFQSPLSIAIKSWRRDIIELLIDEDVNINRVMSNDHTPLMLAIENGDIDTAKLLIENGAFLDGTSWASVKGGKWKKSPSSHDIANGYNTLLICALLICATAKGSKSPLTCAIAKGRNDIVEMLIGKGADLEACNFKTCETALIFAAQEGRTSITRLLLEKGANMEARDILGATPLSWAASFGHEDAIELLLANNANIEAATIFGHTPLGSAALLGQTDAVRLLLDNDANLEATDILGRTPLVCAIVQNRVPTIRTILSSRKAKVHWRDKQGCTLMHYAVKEKNIHSVKLLLGVDKVEADEKDNDGRTPFSYAAELEDRSDIWRAMLASGKVDVNTRDNRGRTPLLLAMEHKEKRLMEELLNLDSIDPDAKDDEGRTPLRYAIEFHNRSAIRVLMSSRRHERVDFNAKDDDGRTPLQSAMRWKIPAITEALLLTGKVDTNAEDEEGFTPLLYAIETGDVPLLKLLLNSEQVNTNAKDEYGQVDANAADERGQTPLFDAIQEGQIPIIQALLDSGKVDAHIKDMQGRTPLSYAMEIGDKFIVKALLDLDTADIDIRDGKGRTPLSYAASYDVARMLIKARKVDVNSKDKQVGVLSFLFDFIVFVHSSSGGTLVRICTPCHSLTRSPKAAFTILCCFNIFNPLNTGEVMSIAYMLPQPPDMSCTSSDVGFSFSAKTAAIEDSAGDMSASCSSSCSFEEGEEYLWRGVEEKWRDVVEERERVRRLLVLVMVGLNVFATEAIAVREGREAVARRRRRSAERQEEQIMIVIWQFEVCPSVGRA
ncbi:uncharacterized protein Triagg1_1438 [Trichoderma aggressivum f. europaeum]|uniref:Nucleoside phosphorylase domain-containing protein n=1 Tax=Trichoderma aggressivum f. europaeum TaxID=173218 RepID=A0AAE1IKR3_9HYPO|nr:hypothetical protein Triagg1_1438 [Trichoderma aggressivum f. europaeum]